MSTIVSNSDLNILCVGRSRYVVDIMINQFIIRKCIGVHGVHHMTSQKIPSFYYVSTLWPFWNHLMNDITINFIIRENTVHQFHYICI